MSIYWKGSPLSLENYGVVFRGYSSDIRDEVRGMVLDGVDLTGYIDTYIDKPEMLHQMRLAVLDEVPEKYFVVGDWQVLKGLRSLSNLGYDLSYLDSFLTCGFSPEQWSYIAKWFKNGIAIKEVGIERLPSDLWEIADRCFRVGFPVEKLCKGVYYSPRYVSCTLGLLSRGIPMGSLLDGSVYRLEVLELLASSSNKTALLSVIPFLIPNSTLEETELFLEIAENLDKDELGTPISVLMQVGVPEGVPASDVSSYFYLYSSDHLKKIKNYLSVVKHKGNLGILLDYSIDSNELRSRYLDLLATMH